MKSSMKRILALILFLGKGINGDFGLYKSVDASVSKIQLTGLDEGEIYKVCVKAWKREKGEESSIWYKSTKTE